MRTLAGILGIFLYKLLLPVWHMYFRIYPTRSRVVILKDRHVLLVRGLLSSNKWGLPGGGLNKNETAINSAVREVKEELDVEVDKTNLDEFGEYKFKVAGVSLTAVYFRYETVQELNLKAKFPEILEAKWFDANTVHSINISRDTAWALQKLKML